MALGVLGMALPLLPTTPFVLLAAGCYVRAWPRAHRWLRRSRIFGPMCRAGAEGRHLPARAKAMAIAVTLISFGISAVLVGRTWPMLLLLALLCAAVITWLWRLPAQPTASAPDANFGNLHQED